MPGDDTSAASAQPSITPASANQAQDQTGPKVPGAEAGQGTSTQDVSSTASTSQADGASEKQQAAEPEVDPEELVKAFFSELRDVDRDNEVNRILWAFKLNPFEKLNLRFDATPEDVKKQYRKLSLMVHPDKCKHPQASAAFDILGEAQKELLNEERREPLLNVLSMARDDIRKERKKATKHDNLVKVASLLHEKGREGVEAEWEQTDEFHESWKLKARELLANSEWRRRKVTKRLKDDTARVEAEEAENREKMKKAREHAQQWETSREERVSSWRDFAAKKTGKQKKAVGELKPPKLKTNDDDKLYVQRAVTEQFRPAQPPQQMQPQFKPKPR